METRFSREKDNENERKRLFMSKAVKTRKPLSAKTKGAVCLAVLLALLIFVSCISVGGMKLDASGVNVLLPWVPVSGANWPQSLPLTRALGGGTKVNFDVVLPENGDMPKVVEVLNARLDGMGETDRVLTVEGDTLSVELRKMDHDYMHSLLALATMPGMFDFTDASGMPLATEKDVTAVNVGYNSTGTSFVMTITVTDEAAQAMAGNSMLSVFCDGSQVTTYALLSGNQISINLSDYNTVSNLAYLLNTGAIEASLTESGETEIEASGKAVLTVVVIASALLLIAALAYMIMKGKLTGVSAFLAAWCAVMLEMFFVATIVVPSVYALNVGCLIALLINLLLILFAAVSRTEAISHQIGEGSGPKQATKLGMRLCAKNVWIAHGALLVISLLLMIFKFSEAVGYTLCAGVVASAITTVLLRAFQACFAAICNKPALYGKVK